MKIFKPLYFSFSSSFSSMEYGWDYMYDEGTQFKNKEFSFSPALTLPFTAIPWLTMDFSASSDLSYSWRSFKPGAGLVDEGVWFGNYTLNAGLTGPVLYRIYNLKPAADGQARRLKHVFEPFAAYRYESPYLNMDRIASAYPIFRYHQLSYGLNNHFLVKAGTSGAPREIRRNPEVSFSVYGRYAGFTTCRCVQLWGRAFIIEQQDEEYARAHAIMGLGIRPDLNAIDLEAVQASMCIIKIVPQRARILNLPVGILNADISFT